MENKGELLDDDMQMVMQTLVEQGIQIRELQEQVKALAKLMVEMADAYGVANRIREKLEKENGNRDRN